jgi:outer membrane receptor protein involved in Fe transport
MAQKTSKGRKGLSSSSALMALAAVAVAAPTAAHAQDGEPEDETIIVTGSRIAQDSTLTAPSPVIAVGGDDIRTSGQIDITTLLRESPALQSSLPGSFSAFNGTPLGASTLNLRGLGDVRTLVLENGRRHVPGIEGTGTVDVNTISTALLERVDVFTGGASAVYGADAVSGVVNFILRNGASFDGFEVRGQAGISDDGDADETFISIATGSEFAAGRGSFVAGIEYQTTESLTAGERSFAGSGLRQLVANGPATGVPLNFSNTWIPDLRLPISSGGGVIAIGEAGTFPSAFLEVLFADGTPGCFDYGASAVPTCQYYERETGTLRPYNPGDVFIDAFTASGGDGIAAVPDSEVIWPQSERIMLQGILSFEVLENTNFFIDFKFVSSETIESDQVNGFNDDIPIALDNPFIPAPLRAQLDQLILDGDNPEVVMSRDALDLAARSNPIAERETIRIVAGFEGEFFRTGLDYQIYYNYGRTDADITVRQRFEDRYFAAIDAIEDPDTGEIVCRSDRLDLFPTADVPPSSPFPSTDPGFGITTFTPGDGQCAPIDLNGENSMSEEAAAFVFQPTTSRNEIEQENIVAVISGNSERMFSLPAGPVRFALGYEWRKETSSFTPDPVLAVPGLTFTTLDSRFGPQNASFGAYEVDELFGELQVPILANQPFAHLLEFNGAYRQSDYDTFGETDTWTMGGRWAPIESLTFRYSVAEAVRVPNIGEAFSPQFGVSIGATDDPCNVNLINAGSEFRFANCEALIGVTVTNGTYNSADFLSAQVPGTSGGNPNLNPEEAETTTIGFVWRPLGDFNGLFDGLIVTVDHYDIKITGLIASLSGFEIAQNCVDQ